MPAVQIMECLAEYAASLAGLSRTVTAMVSGFSHGIRPGL